MLLLIWTTFVVFFGESLQEPSQPYTLYEIYVLEVLQYPQEDNKKESIISEKEVEDCFKEYANVESEREQLEKNLAREGRVFKINDKVTDISIIRRRRTDPYIRKLEGKQLPFQTVSNALIERHKLSHKNIVEDLPQQQMRGQYCDQAIQECIEPLNVGPCDENSLYRTADGSCNNLQNPSWGSVGTCFRRLLPSNYQGDSGFRQSVNGGSLPPPRTLSVNVHSHLNRPTSYITHMYMFFGQLLDHDISQSPLSTTIDNEAINCCPPAQDNHPQCAPIIIPQDDGFYSQFGTTCMNFVRSAICPTCSLGPRQQLNQITAFIDASFVYGNSLNETLTLRANDGTGRLRIQRTSTGDFLPPSPDPRNDQCSFVETNDICFQGGDARVNQHTTLTSLHTLFLRQHNRLADGLRRMNPQWNDERLFQESRKILGAIMQVITYKEYLPITLGSERMTFFKLWLSDWGSTNYDPSIDPSLYNEFSGAAFRFGHSLINSIVAQSPLNGTNGRRLLRDDFFQPFDVRTGIVGPLLNGVTRSSAQLFDQHLVPDVTNYLYRIRGDPSGLDLASINIQRGRDHGLPSYTQMVNFCSDNVYTIRQFRDLVDNKIMSYNNARLLQNNYRHVDDIDLWTGILSETPSDSEAVIGPTATCVIGLQFNRLKFGDRFYFEHRNENPSFSYQQMKELRKMTLSKMICLNTDVKQIALNAMLFSDRNNPVIYCPYVKDLDLSYWRE